MQTTAEHIESLLTMTNALRDLVTSTDRHDVADDQIGAYLRSAERSLERAAEALAEAHMLAQDEVGL